MSNLKLGSKIAGVDIETVEGAAAKIGIPIPYGVTSGTNTYTVAPALPALVAYTDGVALAIKIGTTNTGASTINSNGLGAKNILDSKGNAMTAGKLRANSIYTLRYNGTDFILQGEGGGGTAVAGDILVGKTATNDSGDITGTMPNNGAGGTITPSTGNQSVASGYWSSPVTVLGDPDLVPGNIKSGSNIFGVVGNPNVVDTSPGTAIAGEVLNGKIVFVDGVQITGTIPNQLGVIAPLGVNQWGDGALAVYPPQGYYKGGTGDGELKVSPAQLQAAEVDLIPANIKTGKNMFSIVGTLEDLSRYDADAIAGATIAVGDSVDLIGYEATKHIPYTRLAYETTQFTTGMNSYASVEIHASVHLVVGGAGGSTPIYAATQVIDRVAAQNAAVSLTPGPASWVVDALNLEKLRDGVAIVSWGEANNLWCAIITVDANNAVTWGLPYMIPTTVSNKYMKMEIIDVNKVLFLFHIDNLTRAVAVGVISGTAISFGATTTFNPLNYSWNAREEPPLQKLRPGVFLFGTIANSSVGTDLPLNRGVFIIILTVTGMTVSILPIQIATTPFNASAYHAYVTSLVRLSTTVNKFAIVSAYYTGTTPAYNNVYWVFTVEDNNTISGLTAQMTLIAGTGDPSILRNLTVDCKTFLHLSVVGATTAAVPQASTMTYDGASTFTEGPRTLISGYAFNPGGFVAGSIKTLFGSIIVPISTLAHGTSAVPYLASFAVMQRTLPDGIARTGGAAGAAIKVMRT